MSDMTPEMLEDCVEGHAEWYCEDVAFEPYIAAWRTDRRTIDALAAALRAVDGILMDEIAGWQDGGGPSLDELKQRRLAALEPVKAWL